MATINAINNTVSNANFTVPNGTITAGTGLTVTTGDATISSGTLNLPTTSSTVGFITINNVKFVSGYGTSNCFFGPTGNTSLSGTENAMVGSGGASMTSASANASLGIGALNSITSGSYQVALGYNALYSQQTNWFNIAIGYKALFASTDAGNIAIGPSAMEALNSGQNNLGVGWQSLSAITTGSRNHAFGYQAGATCTTSDSDNLFLNSPGVAGDNHTIRIGNQGSGGFQQNKCYIAGIVGVTTSNSQHVTIDSSTGQLGVTTQPNPWTVITVDQTAVINNGYIVNKGSRLDLLLPATSAVGDIIQIVNINIAGGIRVTQGAGQQIFLYGGGSSTVGATGYIQSTSVGECITLVCRTANTVWWQASGSFSWANV